MTSSVLQIRGLEKRYGPVVALAGLDLTIGRGRIYGFIGPNGAGKTTTIRILAGLVRPTAGEIRLEGWDLAVDRLAVARDMRTLVETPSFYPALTGWQNLAVHTRLVGETESEIDRLLDAVALVEAGDRKVGTYSLGMRQRLGIAQALVGRPRLVVLDEPMNGLDPAGMREMRRLIREQRDEHGVTFLISSHLLYDVQQLCDDVGIIHRGRMVAEGRIQDLLSSAISGFRFETADNRRAADVLRRAVPDARARADEDGLVLVEGDESTLPALHAALLQAGLPALAVVPLRASLERYFLEMTEGGDRMKLGGALRWLFATAVVVWAALELFLPSAQGALLTLGLAAAGALLGAWHVAGPVGKRARWGRAALAAVLLAVAVQVLRPLMRWLAGEAPARGTWALLPWLVLLVVLLLDLGAVRRVGRLIGVEGYKTRHSPLLRFGMVGALSLTLLAALTREHLPDTTGWSVLAGTLTTGLWGAEVFLLVLGATAIAGEATGGTLKMMLPHAYRRADWVLAKAAVLALASALFLTVVGAFSIAHAALTLGLGDVAQTVEPLLRGEEPTVEVFTQGAAMWRHLATLLASGLGALVVTGLLGLFCSALFDSVVASLCVAFILFAGLEFADVLLRLSQEALRRTYGWYPDRIGTLLEKLGRALSERWDTGLLSAGLVVALVTGALLLLASIRAFDRRDVHA